MKLQELYTELEISYGAIFDTVHDVLQYWKAKAQREPKGLMDKHKLEQLEHCFMMLILYATEGTAFLKRTVAGNKRCINHTLH